MKFLYCAALCFAAHTVDARLPIYRVDVDSNVGSIESVNHHARVEEFGRVFHETRDALRRLIEDEPWAMDWSMSMSMSMPYFSMPLDYMADMSMSMSMPSTTYIFEPFVPGVAYKPPSVAEAPAPAPTPAFPPTVAPTEISFDVDGADELEEAFRKSEPTVGGPSNFLMGVLVVGAVSAAMGVAIWSQRRHRGYATSAASAAGSSLLSSGSVV